MTDHADDSWMDGILHDIFGWTGFRIRMWYKVHCLLVRLLPKGFELESRLIDGRDR